MGAMLMSEHVLSLGAHNLARQEKHNSSISVIVRHGDALKPHCPSFSLVTITLATHTFMHVCYV